MPPATQSGRDVLSSLSGNVSRAPMPTAGKKRKSDESGPIVNLDDIDCHGMSMDKNCDQVRRKIRSYLDSGEMKTGDFARAIRVSDSSLRTFLRQSGQMNGAGSSTYGNAWEFFKKREIAGLKTPSKKTKTSATHAGSDNAAVNNVKAAGNSAGVDLSSIYLQNEMSDDVEVYDSCDEVRHKIDAHLKKPGVTQAQFCRDLKAQLHAHRASSVQPSQLTAFRSKHGPTDGNTSSVYYAAYVFFEKMRIEAGKEKSKHRIEMEKIWPGGVELDRVQNRFFCGPGEEPHLDSFGRVFFH